MFLPAISASLLLLGYRTRLRLRGSPNQPPLKNLDGLLGSCTCLLQHVFLRPHPCMSLTGTAMMNDREVVRPNRGS